MINAVILYANIVQVNRQLFSPKSKVDILTVFIAWLNLDFGIETCFYDGMTAYAQTWLQFAFPIYVWLLISLIILTSRYSITVSKLIGSNPIAVLATLLLMSYNKILKVIIEVYSYAHLSYPQNKTVNVWLKDGNVPYMESWHLVIAVVTSLILIFLFLPYTIFLLFGYKLYYFPNRKYLHWINNLKPLLDSYYAPYKIRTRYWTGFFLLVRCALYLVFSFGSEGQSALAITITFACTGFALGYIRIYRSIYVNLIETSIYLNLIVLSGFTITGYNSTALLYTLVGVVFVTTMGVIAYHFHIAYIAKLEMWLKIKAKLLRYSAINKMSSDTLPSMDYPATTTPTSTVKGNVVPSQSVIELREPLLVN